MQFVIILKLLNPAQTWEIKIRIGTRTWISSGIASLCRRFRRPVAQCSVRHVEAFPGHSPKSLNVRKRMEQISSCLSLLHQQFPAA